MYVFVCVCFVCFVYMHTNAYTQQLCMYCVLHIHMMLHTLSVYHFDALTISNICVGYPVYVLIQAHNSTLCSAGVRRFPTMPAMPVFRGYKVGLGAF